MTYMKEQISKSKQRVSEVNKIIMMMIKNIKIQNGLIKMNFWHTICSIINQPQILFKFDSQNQNSPLLDYHLENTKGRIQCIHLNAYDDYNSEERSVYYLGAYDLFLKGCSQKTKQAYGVHNENIKQWNERRDVIEWALRNLVQGDRVFVDSPFNLLWAIVLSKIVAPQGSVSWSGINLANPCLKANLELYKITNLITYNNEDLQNFNVFIGESQSLPKRYENIVESKDSFKIFFFLGDPSSLQYLSPKVKTQKYVLNNKKCGELFIIGQIKGHGYYSITNLNHVPSAEPIFPKIEMPITTQMKTNYLQYISEMLQESQKRLTQLEQMNSSSGCLNPSFSRVLPDSQVLTIYDSKLYNISETDLKEWEKHREPIEWIRSQAQKGSTVYYQMKEPTNLLIVTQIARIIKDGTLIVYCSDDECGSIQSQIDHFLLTNVQIISDSGQQLFLERALRSNFLITDNTNLITQITKTQFLKQGRLLAKFDQNYPQTNKVFGNVVAFNKLTQIKLYPDGCQGFQKDHYFWGSDQIDHFYEVTTSKRYIFMFWGGLVSTLPFRRRHFLEEAILNSKVEVKIVNTKILFMMESEKFPIHKSYTLLSEVHRSDYARAYLMYVYGGGYIDTKHVHFDWNPYFSDLENNPELYAVGYPQIQANDVGCYNEPGQTPCSLITSQYRRMIGNGLYIYRKQTAGSEGIIKKIHSILDKKTDLLKRNPPRHARDQIHLNGSSYPIRWAQLNGQLRSRECYNAMDRYKLTMPFVVIADYLSLS